MLKKLLFVCFSVFFSLIVKADIFNCNTVEEIHYALANVQTGDEIVIATGTYISDASINAVYYYSPADWTASQPIIIRCESASDPAYLKGISITSKTVLRIEEDYGIVKDLDLSNGQKALVFDNSNYSKSINCVIHTTSNEAVHIRDGSNYVVINGCTINNTGNDNPGFGEGIYIGTDKGSMTTYNIYCDYTLVKNCTLGPEVRSEFSNNSYFY